MSWHAANICKECYVARYPDRIPHTVAHYDADEENCCFCGKKTRAGIYVRANSVDLKCEHEKK